MNQQHQHQQHQQQDLFRPPKVSFVIGIGLVCGCYYFHLLSQRGYGGWANLAAMVAAAMAVKQFIRALDDGLKVRAYRRRKRAFEAAAAFHGQSSYATHRELADAGLIAKKPSLLSRIKSRLGGNNDE